MEDVREQIFEIEGVKYKRSSEPLKDNDEVFCICTDPSSKVPYGTKGFIASVWYDRVNYLGNEYVIWGHETAKLIPVIDSKTLNKEV